MPLDHPGNKKPRRCLFLRGLWSFLDCFGKFGGGQGGIRTHGTLARTPDFESGTFDHSATCPRFSAIREDGNYSRFSRRLPDAFRAVLSESPLRLPATPN